MAATEQAGPAASEADSAVAEVEVTDRAERFSGGVVVLFVTQVFGAGTGIISGILLARLLGPTAKGDYYLLTLLPATAMVILQLGLPRAFGYYTARGIASTILTKAFALSGLLSIVAFGSLLLLLPFLLQDLLKGLDVQLILISFLAFPLAINGAFTIAIIMGRQGVRWYAGINIAYSIAALVLVVGFLLGIGPTVEAAIAAYVLSTLIQTVASAIGARRVTKDLHSAERVTYRGLFRYGLPFFPGSLAVFFSYRVDSYLIAFLLTDAATALGYYSLAVGLAEMVFFFPRAVSTLYFPHVAGSAREDADRQVGMTSRVTVLITGLSAIALAPAAVLLIYLILPAFVSSIAPLLLLLPGIVTFSVTFVVNGYMTGIDRPGITSVVSVVSLVANFVANLFLIPAFGIVGAAAASLFSYTLSSVLLTIVASRLTGTAFLRFWIPGPSDLRFTIATTIVLLRRLRRPASVITGRTGAN